MEARPLHIWLIAVSFYTTKTTSDTRDFQFVVCAGAERLPSAPHCSRHRAKVKRASSAYNSAVITHRLCKQVKPNTLTHIATPTQAQTRINQRLTHPHRNPGLAHLLVRPRGEGVRRVGGEHEAAAHRQHDAAQEGVEKLLEYGKEQRR